MIPAQQGKGELAGVTELQEEVELSRSGYEEHSTHEEHCYVKLWESFLEENPAPGVASTILADDDGPSNIGAQTKIGGELQPEEEEMAWRGINIPAALEVTMHISKV